MRSLGIDVGVDKGLDVVLLDEALVPKPLGRRVAVEQLGALIDDAEPDVIAIDAPPAWGKGRCGGLRCTERELLLLGIRSFGTPTHERGSGHRFYRWMDVGFRVFRKAAERGYPRYRSGEPRGHAIEVFPHASAVVLAGCLPPKTVVRRQWRTGVLRARGVAADGLASPDQVDATLAALTGLLALRGERTALGDPDEGVIVLPGRSLPPPPYRRCVETSRADTEQGRFFRPCACGDAACRALTHGEFAPGHDAKRKSWLWEQARQGHEAMEELRSRGWELPPEMR